MDQPMRSELLDTEDTLSRLLTMYRATEQALEALALASALRVVRQYRTELPVRTSDSSSNPIRQ